MTHTMATPLIIPVAIDVMLGLILAACFAVAWLFSSHRVLRGDGGRSGDPLAFDAVDNFGGVGGGGMPRSFES